VPLKILITQQSTPSLKVFFKQYVGVNAFVRIPLHAVVKKWSDPTITSSRTTKKRLS
jgi:hypothetical protein